jgi:hypothetical protein
LGLIQTRGAGPPYRRCETQRRHGNSDIRRRAVQRVKFLWLDPAWIDELGAIRDIIKKALASAGKGK